MQVKEPAHNTKYFGIFMKRNVGSIDSIVRLIVGGALLYIGFFDNPVISAGISKILVGIFGLIVFVSALVRNCPLYYLIGLNTCSRKQH